MLQSITNMINKQFGRYATVAVSITKVIDRPVLKRILAAVPDSLISVFVYRSRFSEFL